MDSSGYLLLDSIELFLSIIGFIVFMFLFIKIDDNQRIMFLIAAIYLIYNSYSKICLLNIKRKKNRIIKYYGRKINI